MNNIRIMYLRSQQGAIVGCVACQVKRAGHEYIGNYQISVLNPSDRFDRKLARAIAKGRLLENPHHIELPTVPSMHEVTERIMRSILVNKDAPTRARKAAQRWLDETERTFTF